MLTFYKFLKLDKKTFDNHKDAGYYISCILIAFIFIAFHLGFLVYYLIIGLMPMIVINAVSMLFYLVSLILSFKNKSDTASIFIITEIAIYCVISVYLVGWPVGTQWYLPIAVLPCYFAFNLKPARRKFYVFILYYINVFLLLDGYFRGSNLLH